LIISIYETEKLLRSDQTYAQLGFSMLLARLKIQYAQDDSQENLQKCADEINAFFNKFVKIMARDLESIVKLVKTDGGHQVLSFSETEALINEGKLLHIAGTEKILRKLPKGNWIGGSTEYFMTEDGGLISGDLMFVTEFPYQDFQIKTYDASQIENVANDSDDNGFTLMIIPFDSDVHITYAENAANYQNIFMRNIVGWISGTNLEKKDQTPTTVNGMTQEISNNKAVAMHVKIPDDKTIELNIINIFEQDENSPVIEFQTGGFSAEKCLINGEERVFADYIAEKGIDIKLPLVGDFSGHGINISFKSINNGVVNFYAPVIVGIKYRIAKAVPDYFLAFHDRVSKLNPDNVMYSCNCILNFLYGGLEGKKIAGFPGPVTFGEIAYQLVNQTLVYLTIQ